MEISGNPNAEAERRRQATLIEVRRTAQRMSENREGLPAAFERRVNELLSNELGFSGFQVSFDTENAPRPGGQLVADVTLAEGGRFRLTTNVMEPEEIHINVMADGVYIGYHAGTEWWHDTSREKVLARLDTHFQEQLHPSVPAAAPDSPYVGI